MDPALVEQVLDDYTTAPIPETLRSTLAFLKKLTLTPEAVSPADIQPMRAAGVSTGAIEEAIYVCFLFNLMDRLADALDFELPSKDVTNKTSWMLHKFGYKIGVVPG